MNNEYIKLFKDLDKIRKQLDSGKRQYSYKKHIKSKTKNSLDIYAQKKNKSYKNDSDYVFLLDNSGSMSGLKCDIQVNLITKIATCLESMNKKYAIYGFTGCDDVYNYHDFCYAKNYEFIPINKMDKVKKIDKDKLKRSIGSVRYEGQNEYVNLQLIYDDILEYKKKNHKNNRTNIIMFSDGQCTNFHDLLKDVINNILANSYSTNVYLYIFNIMYNPGEIYGKISAMIENEKEVPREFKKLIRMSEKYNG